jgi:hypothetical protein
LAVGKREIAGDKPGGSEVNEVLSVTQTRGSQELFLAGAERTGRSEGWQETEEVRITL